MKSGGSALLFKHRVNVTTCKHWQNAEAYLITAQLYKIYVGSFPS